MKEKNKYRVIAKHTMGYPEYKVPNWIEGNEYEAIDELHSITMSSETGPFHFDRKENWLEIMSESFDFQLLPKVIEPTESPSEAAAE